ncbi:hypothetical protein IVB46_01015 [Bradyrhizobium sp. 61]|uniref:hypothetical protein n=1 Tax=unclassified Bradyrhizobium TaxID=2631580 RepID=UPI001FFB82E6|nr:MULTISPECIES: hypothetical protein [unclassified Bradyrhizobium]MCK1273824.1 hypothetical protein [Bradyrhizobium sp. 61]MCK1448024.1 hypothetical protein [Bradyrhizobium sp. 48]
MGKKYDALLVEHVKLQERFKVIDEVNSILQADTTPGEYLAKIALAHLWKLLGAEHQTGASQALRDLIAERDALKRAVDLAVAMLAPHEPGHSCAVSDEFVALAAVSTGDTSPQVMEVIDRPRDPASFNAVPINLEVVVS